MAIAVSGCGTGSDARGERTFPGEKVVASPTVSEEGATANAEWLAWMQEGGATSPPPRIPANVFVRDRATGRTRQVNPTGTYAETGSLLGSQLVFQLIRRNQSSIAAADLRTGKVSLLPGYVNAGGWLWRLSASGRHILFGQIDTALNRYSIVLVDQRTRTRRVVASTAGQGAYAAPGQINGDWVTWTLCPANACNVYRLNLRTGAQSAAPNPPAPVLRQQYGPSVSRTGTVYFGRTLTGCDTQIRRWRGGDHADVIATLPANTAFQYSFLEGSKLLYDPFPCVKRPLADVYALAVEP